MNREQMLKSAVKEMSKKQAEIDTLKRNVDEANETIRALKAQVAGLLVDRRFPDLRVG